MRRAQEALERERIRMAMSQGAVAEELTSAATYLETIQERANFLGHRATVNSAVNRDGTSDLQLMIYDWPLKGLREAFFNLFADLKFPKLGKGIKVRLSVRISADRIDRMKAKGKKAAAKYQYLPTVNGQRTIFYQYRDERTIAGLQTGLLNAIEKFVSDGWRLVALVVDARFDPRWTLRTDKRRK